ncbi:nucleoside phosphorylase domain-containing protein [Xylariaceae sp. FL0255]|nr:nucleoside phosphorylase domain-containing protein [Xylariaceae sp. FL0255]
MLDVRWWDPVSSARGDSNIYALGRIGPHNVVVVGPPRGAQGTVATAQFVSTIRLTFPNITVGLLVGIGSGIPRYPERDVRLGDVVVGAPEKGPAVTKMVLDKPTQLLLQVVNKVETKSKYIEDEEDGLLGPHLARFSKYPRLQKETFRKPSTSDRLFKITYPHQPGSDCNTHAQSTILSGGSIMKSPKDRDMLSAKHNNALCIEMEAAGLMDVFPCLVIRGISDYADSHKNTVWQGFAAATAAVYAREFLLNVPEQVMSDSKDGTSSIGAARIPSPQANGAHHTPFSSHHNSGVQVGYNTGKCVITVIIHTTVLGQTVSLFLYTR